MESPVVRRNVRVGDKDPLGLHLRPAQLLSQLAANYECEIEIVRESLRVDAKSIIHVMTLAAAPGTELVLEANGGDAQEAVNALASFIENGFAVENNKCQKAGEVKGPTVS